MLAALLMFLVVVGFFAIALELAEKKSWKYVPQEIRRYDHSMAIVEIGFCIVVSIALLAVKTSRDNAAVMCCAIALMFLALIMRRCLFAQEIDSDLNEANFKGWKCTADGSQWHEGKVVYRRPYILRTVHWIPFESIDCSHIRRRMDIIVETRIPDPVLPDCFITGWRKIEAVIDIGVPSGNSCPIDFKERAENGIQLFRERAELELAQFSQHGDTEITSISLRHFTLSELTVSFVKLVIWTGESLLTADRG